MSLLECLHALRAAGPGGDVSRATEELYAILRSKLLEPLAARISGRAQPRLDAEDALHEAFLRALAELDTYRGNSEVSFLSWIYRIARNLIADQAKRCSAQAVRFGEDSRSGGPRLSRVPAAGGDAASLGDRRDWIETVLGRLDPEDAALIRARHFEDLSYVELGARTGRSPEAAKQAFWRAWHRFLAVARESR